MHNDVLMTIKADIVDDFLLAAMSSITYPLIVLISSEVELETISHGPDTCSISGPNFI